MGTARHCGSNAISAEPEPLVSNASAATVSLDGMARRNPSTPYSDVASFRLRTRTASDSNSSVALGSVIAASLSEVDFLYAPPRTWKRQYYLDSRLNLGLDN